MDAVVSHPQVVFAAERLQQLLVVSVAHLTQKGQQTRHKLSLTGGNRARQEERQKRVNTHSVRHISYYFFVLPWLIPWLLFPFICNCVHIPNTST